MIIRLLLSLYLATASNVTVNRIPSTGTPPDRRLYAECVYLLRKLYYFGGQSASGDIMNQLHIFHVDTELWDVVEPIDDVVPVGRMLFAMYATDSAIFLHGGIGPYGKLKDLWSYDPREKTWQKCEQYGDIPPPLCRQGFTDFSHNAVKYFSFGCFGTEESFGTDDLYLYNTLTKTWRKMPKIAKTGHFVPSPRRQCTLEYYEGFIYLWGGDLNDLNGTDAAVLYRYDLTSEAWEVVEVIGDLPVARSFFGSGIYNDAFYIFPGWVDSLGLTLDSTSRLDLSKIGSSENPTWELLSIQQIVNYSTYIPRDAYASSLIENRFYIQGGYSAHGHLGNYILKLDLDQSPIGLTLLNPNVDIPTKRYFSTLTLISGKFYMFGGSTGTKELDELWVYDDDQGTWTLKDTIGAHPKARQGHSAVAFGDSLIIWGGKNGSDFYQDLLMYNTLTNIWEVVEVKSTIYPSGGEGACMEVYKEDLYIFGGKNEFSANNYLWKFNLGPNEYKLLSRGDYYSPPELAYSTWYTIEDKMYIMYGIMNDTGSPYTIHAFDFETQRFEMSDLTLLLGLSNVASGKAGKSIIIANGSQWNTRALNQVHVLDIESKNIKHVYDLEWITFAEASVYYKNSLYVFGGGDAEKDGSVRRSRSVNRFYKINFPDMPCSLGTYPLENQCTSCPLGTYKDTYGPTECILWPSGSYNDRIGAANSSACIPWPEGMFNEKPGQHFCLKCMYSAIWPAGTVTPREKTVHGNEYSNTQPDEYETYKDKADHWSLYTLIYMNMGFVLVVLSIVFWKQIRDWIPTWDMFIDQHNHVHDKVMRTRRTLIGGISSILVYGAVIFLTIQSLLYFFYDNIEETKSLLPIVVVHELYDTIKGTVDIKVRFNDYHGQCVTEDNEWMPEITYTKTNIQGIFSELSCSAKENICFVEVTCNHWVLERNAEVTISSYENKSSATKINVEVSSKSSIPEYSSKIAITQSVESGGVFLGAEPTVFHFDAIPSVFESEIENEPSQETGYHLSLGDSSEQGSSYTVENLAKTRFLHTKVRFSQGYVALQTRRTYKIRNDILTIGIIGAIAGVIDIAVLIMQRVEGACEKQTVKYVKQEISRRQLRSKRTLTRYWMKTIISPQESDEEEQEDEQDENTTRTADALMKRMHLRSNQHIDDYMYEQVVPTSMYQDTDGAVYSDSDQVDHEEISAVILPT